MTLQGGGATPSTLLPPLFDAFPLPSLWEGFLDGDLEAMAAGLPVIASASATTRCRGGRVVRPPLPLRRLRGDRIGGRVTRVDP
jgi:hypothetical protein